MHEDPAMATLTQAQDTSPYWRFSVQMRSDLLDAEAEGIASDIQDFGISSITKVTVAHIYYVQADLDEVSAARLANQLLSDPISQEVVFAPVDGTVDGDVIEVAYRPGVRDPVEDSLRKGATDLEIGVQGVHTSKAYAFEGTPAQDELDLICSKLLVNATIQQVITAENLNSILYPSTAAPETIDTIPLRNANDTELQRLSKELCLSLTLEEMKSIVAYYNNEDREPTLIELETLAQTWSEHCKHKTFSSQIVYTEEVDGQEKKEIIQNLLKDTVMKATKELDLPWCISVFHDNSGVIAFDDEDHVCFKVETHNHPSALEPFGGASTGLGGVIRDIMGTGRAAKPIASTDVFCFAPPDLPAEEIPKGVLAPKRVIKGVVAGVKDYGNKMGIPTVNGAVLFDPRFVGNPLVYCGNVGLIPHDRVEKGVRPGDAIVVVGGRTGRDGIHGATFSSVSLETESEVVSAGAVQIGDPITEKRVLDVLLEARDKDLFIGLTDCGAGGLSSAVGEMGEETGARVDLEKVPLKYVGLTPREIWISESQERMVLGVPPEKLQETLDLFASYGVEATHIGDFTDTKCLELLFEGKTLGELQMDFMHGGVPQTPRAGRWIRKRRPAPEIQDTQDLTPALLGVLGRWDTCSKAWIIRQYDHEVQAGSVIKPLTERVTAEATKQEGPSDAAVVRPKLGSDKGIVISNGINFRYGDIDPYQMALLAIDEVARQTVAVGGNLDELAILDNFCFGDVTQTEILGDLVRTSKGCYDGAMAYKTPFISGKDSLHNAYQAGDKTIQIPATLLISGIGVMPDVTKAISMPAKAAGNSLYIVGLTKEELGGSAYYEYLGGLGDTVPEVDLENAPKYLKALASALSQGLAVSAHDCSEGGLGVAAAEMAFAGGFGLSLDLAKVPVEGVDQSDTTLFSESATRVLVEVPQDNKAAFEAALKGVPVAEIGTFVEGNAFEVKGVDGLVVVNTTTDALAQAWEAPFQGW